MFASGLPFLDVSTSVTTWQLHPEVLGFLVALEAAYLLALTRLHARAPEATPISSNRVLVFSLGVFAFYAAAGTPLHDLGEHSLFFAHMFEHLVLTLIAPPLLLLGIPDWMARPLVQKRGMRPVLAIITTPVIAFAFFNLVTLFTHMPNAMDLILHHHTLHFFSHVLLTASALLMWWPVLSPLAELPRLSYPRQLIYLFVQSFLPAVLSAFIIFGDSVMYHFYLGVPRIWGISAIDDQRIGGLIMKLGGTAVLWTVMSVVFFLWYRYEQRDEPEVPVAPIPLVWEDVQEELARMGLTKG